MWDESKEPLAYRMCPSTLKNSTVRSIFLHLENCYTGKLSLTGFHLFFSDLLKTGKTSLAESLQTTKTGLETECRFIRMQILGC